MTKVKDFFINPNWQTRNIMKFENEIMILIHLLNIYRNNCKVDRISSIFLYLKLKLNQ